MLLYPAWLPDCLAQRSLEEGAGSSPRGARPYLTVHSRMKPRRLRKMGLGNVPCRLGKNMAGRSSPLSEAGRSGSGNPRGPQVLLCPGQFQLRPSRCSQAWSPPMDIVRVQLLVAGLCYCLGGGKTPVESRHQQAHRGRPERRSAGLFLAPH